MTADELYTAAVHFQLDNNRLGYLNEWYSKGLIDKATYDNSLAIPQFQSPDESNTEPLHQLAQQLIDEGNHADIISPFSKYQYDYHTENYTAKAMYKEAYDNIAAQIKAIVYSTLKPKAVTKPKSIFNFNF